MPERVSPGITLYDVRLAAWWTRVTTIRGTAVFTAARSAAPLLTRPAGTAVAAEAVPAEVVPADAVAAEAVPDSASAEPAAPTTREAGTALAAVPMRAAGPGVPGLA